MRIVLTIYFKFALAYSVTRFHRHTLVDCVLLSIEVTRLTFEQAYKIDRTIQGQYNGHYRENTRTVQLYKGGTI